MIYDFFLENYKACHTKVFPEFCQCIMMKKLVYSLSILIYRLFLCIGIVFLVSKIEGNIPEEKDWLKGLARWHGVFI